MATDPGLIRFFSYLSFFTFFMLILVSSDNFMLLFMGWEGVGICSYLLINFWYTRLQANKAAMKAVIVNRIGDYAFVLGMVAVFMTFRSLDFSTVFSLSPYVATWNLQIIGLMFVIAATGKSAQFTLHTWLPDAMEGPTPVSALIHAATMVTAGVFLLIRCSPIFEYTAEVLTLMTILGGVTALFSATVGLVQNDIKRVIAYSTCSQLGYMVMIAGLAQYNVSLFHLFNHAFFKALLFLSAGSIIHALSNEQDMRKMGAMAQRLPFLYTVMIIASLALMGIPFLTGFYSKDVILEAACVRGDLTALFAYWFGGLTAILTAFYSFRLIYLTFWVRTAAAKHDVEHSHPMTIIELCGLSVLAVASIFIGYVCRDFFTGAGSPFFGNQIASSPATILMEMETLPVLIKLLPFIGSTAGALAAIALLRKSNWLASWSSNLSTFKFLANKWYFNMIQNMYVSRFVVLAGYASIWLMDRYMLEQVGSWKDSIFNRKSTSHVGVHAADSYSSQIASPTLVDVHFAARFYTWAIWSWARASQYHLVNLVGTGNSISDYLRSKLVYWKVTLWTNSLFWRALNTGYIPNMISSMLYLILLGFGITYILY
jgi:NADH-ubiquinone oxidoreductase chain 5